jgi:hypothetical protein
LISPTESRPLGHKLNAADKVPPCNDWDLETTQEDEDLYKMASAMLREERARASQAIQEDSSDDRSSIATADSFDDM